MSTINWLGKEWSYEEEMSIDLLEEDKGFIYPYTELQFDDVDRVTTAVILYDNLSYLDYDIRQRDESALSRFFSPQEPRNLDDRDAEDCWWLLRHYTQDNWLQGITPWDVRFSRSHIKDDSMLKIIEDNLRIIRNSGLASRAELEGKKTYNLAEEKLFPKLKEKIPLGERSRDMREVPWDWGESVLLAYAELACRQFGLSPIPFGDIHAESLCTVLAQRSRTSGGWLDQDGNLNPASNIVLTKLVELRFNTLKRTWQMDPLVIRRLRRDTQDIRKKALTGLGAYLQEHVTEFDGDTYLPPPPVTSEINAKIKELEEEIGKYTPDSKDKGRVEVAITGLVGNAAGAFTTVALSGVLGPFAFIAGLAAGAITALTDRELTEHRRRKLEAELARTKKDPLYGTLCLMQVLEEHL